jgi:molybdopterin molybdotransferase
MPQALPFSEARSIILDAVGKGRVPPRIEFVDLADADGRVLAEPVCADRDYPPLDRSVRDGFAVRAADAPGTFTVIGEVRAGERFEGEVQAGQAVEIMTGAPVPDGADAVVMVEHVRVKGDQVSIEHRLSPGVNISPRGCDALKGDEVLRAGQAIGFPEVAVLATVGISNVAVYRRPRVAILTTGDEILSAGAQPLPHQIRDSNAWSLAAQVRRAGGEPFILPAAPDSVGQTTELIGEGLKADLLLISGGVSAGKYDVVESALAKYGGEFYFDRVLVQPGQPLVFGHAQGTFFFGLPGNPASTMVCFEVFARAAVELLGGRDHPMLPLTEAVLSVEFHHRPGLTRFLPASLSADGGQVTPVPWSGSGDVMALARANAFLVAEPDRPHYAAGERIRVLMR